MPNTTVGEYVVKLDFKVDQGSYNKLLKNTISLYTKTLKRQFQMAEQEYILRLNNVNENFQGNLDKLPKTKRINLKDAKTVKDKTESIEQNKEDKKDNREEKKQKTKDRIATAKHRKQLSKDLHALQNVTKGGFRFLVKGLGLGGIAGIGFSAAIGAFIAKSVLGLNPKEGISAIGTRAGSNRRTADLAKILGISFAELKNYELQGQSSGLDAGTIDQLFLSNRSKGLSIDTIKNFIRYGIGKGAVVQKAYADILGVDQLTYNQLAQAMSEGLFGKRNLNTIIDVKKARKESRSIDAGTTAGEYVTDAEVINKAYGNDLKKIADAYIISLNKVILTQVQDLNKYSSSFELSSDLRALVEKGYIYTNSFLNLLGGQIVKDAKRKQDQAKTFNEMIVDPKATGEAIGKYFINYVNPFLPNSKTSSGDKNNPSGNTSKTDNNLRN